MAKVYNEPRFNNFREIINSSAEKYGDRTAFHIRNSDDSFRNITYAELRERYYGLCTFMMNEGLLGKRIAIVGENCYEWVLSYLSAATVGVAVPIDKELCAEDVENFINDAECEAVFTDGKTNLNKNLYKTVINFDNVDFLSGSSKYQIGKLRESDYPVNKANVDSIKIHKEDMQVLIFTSGTSGNSKGVCLSQHAICSNIFSTVSIVNVKHTDRTLSILPLHHTYECTLNCLLILSKGASISYAQSLKRIAKNIVESQPTMLVVVPELLKFLMRRIQKSVADACGPKYGDLFCRYSFAEAMKRTPLPLRIIIKRKVRNTLGGKLRLLIVGAAPLDASLVSDFEALGIRTLQGYGLTECAPLLAGNNDFYFNAASTGVPIPGVQLRIDAPNADGIGEIVAKGENIMIEYYRDAEATENAFRSGWFHTGDLGRFGSDGELYITGRLKNVIVTENGKNVYPEELEARILNYAEVAEVLVVQTMKRDRVCIKAKVLPNFDLLKEMLGYPPTLEEVKETIQKRVDYINDNLPAYKSIRIVEVLSEAFDKTTTRKIKRYGENLS